MAAAVNDPLTPVVNVAVGVLENTGAAKIRPD